MTTIHAIYEDGVFKPMEPVNLPEHCRVRVEAEIDEGNGGNKTNAQTEIYKILDELYDSGDPNGAERHNEHQP